MDSLPRASSTQRILIVDDEPDIHAVTKLSLKALTRKCGPIEFLSASTGAEAVALLKQYPDIAVILLDVVMETDMAGLEACRVIRQELGNAFVRILLRTGQPGVAPEQQTIDTYDIDGYLAKTETSSSRLYTAVRCALKSHRELLALDRHRRYLGSIHDCAVGLNADVSVETMLQAVLGTVMAICPAPLVLLELETFEHGNGPRHIFLYLTSGSGSGYAAMAAEGARARVQKAVRTSRPRSAELLDGGYYVPLSLHHELGQGWIFVDDCAPDDLCRTALTLLGGHAQNAVYASLALSASRRQRALVFEETSI